MLDSDFRRTSEFLHTQSFSGNNPNDYSLGPTNWSLYTGGPIAHPKEGYKAIAPEKILALFRSDLGISPVAIRTMSNLDLLSPSRNNDVIRKAGFTISRLQIALKVEDLNGEFEAGQVRTLVDPDKQLAFTDTGIIEDSEAPTTHAGQVLKAPLIHSNFSQLASVPDFYAMYLRPFFTYDNCLPEDPDTALTAARANVVQTYHPDRVIADLKFLTIDPLRPNAKRPPLARDLNEPIYPTGIPYRDEESIEGIFEDPEHVRGTLLAAAVTAWEIAKVLIKRFHRE